MSEERVQVANGTDAETVLGEYARIDKTIRDCEHALLIAERLKTRGLNPPEGEVTLVRLRLSQAMMAREFMDEWLRRRTAQEEVAG